MEATALLNDVAHPGEEDRCYKTIIQDLCIQWVWIYFWNLVKYSGRPKDEEPHIKRSVKKKKEIVEYIVRVNLKELGIDEANFDELQELFKMFDNDKDGVLSLKEFEKILSVLGRSGGMSDVMTD